MPNILFLSIFNKLQRKFAQKAHIVNVINSITQQIEKAIACLFFEAYLILFTTEYNSVAHIPSGRLSRSDMSHTCDTLPMHVVLSVIPHFIYLFDLEYSLKFLHIFILNSILQNDEPTFNSKLHTNA